MPWDLRADEPVITTALVRSLLSQHPDLARLPLSEPVRGWDNTMVRIGADLALRLPRHATAETLLDHEVQWLPTLARQAGPDAHIPVPVRTGTPTEHYPFRWAVVPWTPGTMAVHLDQATRDAYAPILATLMRSIHTTAPADAPPNPVRGVPVAAIAERFMRRWEVKAPQLPASRRRELQQTWDTAQSAPAFTGEPVWLHGDPHPNNLVVAPAANASDADSPRLVLVDFGDICTGDPASDLGAGLLHFSADARTVFRQTYIHHHDDVGAVGDPALWARAEGWAVHYALIFAEQSEGEVLRPLAEAYLRGLAAG